MTDNQPRASLGRAMSVDEYVRLFAGDPMYRWPERFDLLGTATGRLPERTLSRPVLTVADLPTRTTERVWEIVVDGIYGCRMNEEGLSTNHHQPMLALKSDDCGGEHCGKCNAWGDYNYEEDFWRSHHENQKRQMLEFGVAEEEWDPDIVF